MRTAVAANRRGKAAEQLCTGSGHTGKTNRGLRHPIVHSANSSRRGVTECGDAVKQPGSPEAEALAYGRNRWVPDR